MQFNPKLSWEFLSTEEIASKTLRALRNHIKHVKEVSPYYKEALWDIAPEDIKNINDFYRLPFTGRGSLSDHPEKFIAVEHQMIVETVATGGATGKPIFCPLTSNDLDRLAFSEALSFHSMGISPGDRALLFLGMDRWSLAGIGCYRGLMLAGANTGRAGIVAHDLCRQYCESFKPTVIVGAPSFLRRLALDFGKAGFKFKESGINKIIGVGESLKSQRMEINTIGKKLEEIWGAKAFVNYTITEIADSFCECAEQKGGHAHPELMFPEIVDNDGNPVSDGVPGELVTTSLGVEGMPLVRYRTGDFTFKVPGACHCGRNSVRIGPILGRTNEIIRANGLSVYPLTLTNALDEIDEINDYIIILENGDARGDHVSIHVATQPSAIEKIAKHVRNAVNVSFPILISNISTIQSMRGNWHKQVRIVDWRQQAQRRK
ncbi:MAG: AMP-binding protein [Chitinispirillaceae bacterium]